MAYEKDPNEIGALWMKSGAKGEYMTGIIDGIGAVVLFRQTNKRSEKAPDWRVLKSKPRENTTGMASVREIEDPPF